ncbi:MAG: hypothetical protein ACYDDO_04815 [Acidiferrobacterales bacterium]
MNNKAFVATIIAIFMATKIAAAETLTIALSAAKHSFLDTRGFPNLCRQVMSGALPAKSLPIEPSDFGTARPSCSVTAGRCPALYGRS